MMGEEPLSGSSIKPSTARRPAVSGAIGNVGRGGGRGREGGCSGLMSTPSVLPLQGAVSGRYVAATKGGEGGAGG